jgi:two-component sensor histidine kinase
MKDVPLLRKVLFSSWFLAGIPALVILLLIPPLGSRYKVQIENGQKFPGQSFYADLNYDGISEEIRVGKGVPLYHIIVLDTEHRIFDQWNLQDNIDPDLSEAFVGNFDDDKFKEIYIFTYRGDSLFLNINEFFEPGGTKLERIFITKISVVDQKVTSTVCPAGFYDEDGDGKEELYFTIITGFGLEPRRLYSFDISRKILRSSEFTGMMCQQPSMVDADGDNKPEIFGLMSASGNYRIRPPYSDSSTWFMVFNTDLKFDFPPVEFYGYTNSLEIYDYKNENFRGYILCHRTASVDTNVVKQRIMLYSGDGNLIKYRLFSDFGFSNQALSIVLNHKGSNKIYLLDKEFLELDANLDIIKKVKSPFRSNFYCFKEDIDFDGEKELILYSVNEEKIAIYSGGLQKYTEFKFKLPSLFPKFSNYTSSSHERKLYLKAGEESFFLTLKRNNFYYLGFFAYPGIYFLFFFFILLIRRINTLQVVQKEELKRRLITLQLQGIKSQLDPHFTFNTLNSVASLIYTEERQAAYDYMNKFTQLLRGMLNDAERIYRSVSEEIQFVTTYLDLEKLRFGDKFNYKIEIGEGVTQKEQVPKLVMQTFAENAIKHGIMPSEKGGTLLIRVERENEDLKLTIEDNGIGRERAAGHSTSTGKGLKLTGEFYDILNQLNTKPIRHLITDLYDKSGSPTGTRVDVWIPLELNKDKR